ncbi:hypothetical protein [Psychrobacter sp.]
MVKNHPFTNGNKRSGAFSWIFYTVIIDC